jgi:hypothetical protein
LFASSRPDRRWGSRAPSVLGVLSGPEHAELVFAELVSAWAIAAFEMCESGYGEKRGCFLLRNPAHEPVDDLALGDVCGPCHPGPYHSPHGVRRCDQGGGASGAAAAAIMLCRSRTGTGRA